MTCSEYFVVCHCAGISAQTATSVSYHKLAQTYHNTLTFRCWLHLYKYCIYVHFTITTFIFALNSVGKHI